MHKVFNASEEKGLELVFEKHRNGLPFPKKEYE
jgi:hypothetical protein